MHCKADNRQLQAVLEYKIIIWYLLQLQNQLVKERQLDSKYLDVYMFDGHNINLNWGVMTYKIIISLNVIKLLLVPKRKRVAKHSRMCVSVIAGNCLPFLLLSTQ